MVEGRRREDWAIASNIIAATLNAHAGKVAVQPWQIDPYGVRPVPRVDRTTSDISEAESFFLGD